MAKAKRAPKKETLTEREKELLKQSKAEKRVSNKNIRVNTIIAVIVVVLLVGISTAVGLLVDLDGSDDLPIADNGVVNILEVIDNYDKTLVHLKNSGYIINVDFDANYTSGITDQYGIVGKIVGKAGNDFTVLYFNTPAECAAYYSNSIEMESIKNSGKYYKQGYYVIYFGSGEMYKKCIIDCTPIS